LRQIDGIDFKNQISKLHRKICRRKKVGAYLRAMTILQTIINKAIGIVQKLWTNRSLPWKSICYRSWICVRTCDKKAR